MNSICVSYGSGPVLTSRSSEMQRITLAIQDISIVGSGGPNHDAISIEDSATIETQLTRTMTTIMDYVTAPSTPVEETAVTLLSPLTVPDIVRVVASAGQEPCTRFCRCQCHIQTKATTPRWAVKMLGSFHFQSNGTILLNRRRCNYPLTCKRSGGVTAQFAYYAPAWAMARAFAFGILKDDIRGIAAYFGTGFSNAVPSGSRIFQLVEHGDVTAVRDALVRGQGSLYDVDELGETILHVSISELSWCSRG